MGRLTLIVFIGVILMVVNDLMSQLAAAKERSILFGKLPYSWDHSKTVLVLGPIRPVTAAEYFQFINASNSSLQKAYQTDYVIFVVPPIHFERVVAAVKAVELRSGLNSVFLKADIGFAATDADRVMRTLALHQWGSVKEVVCVTGGHYEGLSHVSPDDVLCTSSAADAATRFSLGRMKAIQSAFNPHVMKGSRIGRTVTFFGKHQELLTRDSCNDAIQLATKKGALLAAALVDAPGLHSLVGQSINTCLSLGHWPGDDPYNRALKHSWSYSLRALRIPFPSGSDQQHIAFNDLVLSVWHQFDAVVLGFRPNNCQGLINAGNIPVSVDAANDSLMVLGRPGCLQGKHDGKRLIKALRAIQRGIVASSSSHSKGKESMTVLSSATSETIAPSSSVILDLTSFDEAQQERQFVLILGTCFGIEAIMEKVSLRASRRDMNVLWVCARPYVESRDLMKALDEASDGRLSAKQSVNRNLFLKAVDSLDSDVTLKKALNGSYLGKASVKSILVLPLGLDSDPKENDTHHLDSAVFTLKERVEHLISELDIDNDPELVYVVTERCHAKLFDSYPVARSSCPHKTLYSLPSVASGKCYVEGMEEFLGFLNPRLNPQAPSIEFLDCILDDPDRVYCRQAGDKYGGLTFNELFKTVFLRTGRLAIGIRCGGGLLSCIVMTCPPKAYVIDKSDYIYLVTPHTDQPPILDN